MNKVRISIAARALAIGVVAALFIVSLQGTGAALSNSGGGSWQYYKEITISNSGGALTDYQVLVTLTSANFPTNARTDGADIRFTDAGGAELSYWIESWDYAGKSAKVWVKVPSVATGATTVRMWYGNPSAGSSSNGDSTFMFFDDFLGSSLDSNKWDKTGDVGYTALSNSIVTFYPAPGSDSGHRTYWNSKYPISTQKFIIQTKMKLPTNQNEYGVWYYNGSGSTVQGSVEGRVRWGNDGMVYSFYDSEAGNYNIGTLTSHDSGFNIWRLERIADNNAKVSVLIGGNWYTMNDVRNPAANDYNFGFWIHNTAYADYFQADWVFAAKLAQPEPTITLGAEQPVSVPVTTGSISVTTNLAGASFTLTGASSYSGSGTSWSKTNVPAGTYTITYGAVAGYNAPPSETKTLSAGGSITFSGTYTQTQTTGISVSSIPSGASIYLDGSYQGKTPKDITDVSVGTHYIELKLDGYKPGSDTIDVKAGSTSYVSVTLTPITTGTVTPTITTPAPTDSPPSISLSKQTVDLNKNGQLDEGEKLVITYGANDDIRVKSIKVLLDGNLIELRNNEGVYTVTTDALSMSDHSIVVEAIDSSGNKNKEEMKVNAKRAGPSVYFQKTKFEVNEGDDVNVILSAVNPIGNPKMDALLILKPPSSGVSPYESDCAGYSGQCTGKFEIQPGDSVRSISVRMKAEKAGEYPIDAEVYYQFDGGQRSPTRYETLTLVVKPKSQATPVNTQLPSTQKTPGFGVIIGIIGLLLITLLKRKR